MKNRICFIITGLTIGGAERQVCDLASQFSLMGHDVIIISMGNTVLVKPSDDRIKIFTLDICKKPLSVVSAFIKLRTIVNDFKPDIVHSHMYHANIFSRLSRFFLKMPKLVSTTHSSSDGGGVRMMLYRLTSRLSDLNTHVSIDGRKKYIEKNAVSKNNMITINNGVDINKFSFSDINRKLKREQLYLNDNHKLFMAVGRLTKAKDYHNLLTAFSIMKDKDDYLAIIGVGELEHELKKLASQLDIKNKVIFLGYQNDVERWLSAADFYVLSSEWEGLPLVVCEAVLTERFVIATDCSGIKELVFNNGMIVPIKNSQLLAKAMHDAKFLKFDKIKSMTYAAKINILENYSLDCIAKKWLSVYEKI